MMLKAKLKAASIHAALTLLFGALAGMAVYWVWYPQPFAEMVHGTDLFLLILLVEIVLGPVISMVIYNVRKPKSELIRDYSIVLLIQLGAFLYGLHSVFISRPAYLVFVKDRVEVVSAVELAHVDYSEVDPEFRMSPWSGPLNVCVNFPDDPKERSDLLFSALEGRDIQLMPRYYRRCEAGEIASAAYASGDLYQLTKLEKSVVPEAAENMDFTWLPVVTRFGAWVVFFPNGETSDRIYADANPFH